MCIYYSGNPLLIITDTIGVWPLLRGCFVHKLFIWDLWVPGRYNYNNWPLFGGI